MKKVSLAVSPLHIAYALQSVVVVIVLTTVLLLIGPKLLGEGVIALLYLVPIGWCTVRWGQSAGVSAALTAAMCFDYLFIPPYNTFNIGSLEGWLLLMLFIGASILVVGRIQLILSEEHSRERKATLLYEMVTAIAVQQTREGIAGTVADQLQQKFLADRVQVNLNDRGGLPSLVMVSPHRPDVAVNRKPDRALPIVSGPQVIGEVDIWKGLVSLPAVDDPLLLALLHQTAAAIERAQAENRTVEAVELV
jgi:K+-sensing histidine kinase KdpD